MKPMWQPVPEFEGIYSVSNLGQVRRERAGHGARVGRHLKQDTRNGYPYVNLHNGSGKYRRFYVHGLVASAFLGPRPPGHEVNHKDGVKANPQADNLEYVTSSGNKRHAATTGLSPAGERRHNAKLTQAAANEIRALAERMSQSELATKFGVHRSTIVDVLNRRTWAGVTP